jgi:D-xylose transport system permease protein
MTGRAPASDTPQGEAARRERGPRTLAQRLRGMETGSLPVLVGLALLWGIFASQNEHFLSARNLTNLVLQIAAMGTMSVGIVLVLLLGEIDLSVGAVSGLCAAVMAVLDVQYGMGAVPSLLAAVATGAAIGLFQGLWLTRFRVPSFVVTLAGLLAWQGALLRVLGPTGTINLYDPAIDGLTGIFLPPWLGWVVGAACIGIAVSGHARLAHRRARAGLAPMARRAVAWRIAVALVVVPAVVALLNRDRGVPLALLLLLAFVAGFDLVMRRTRFGRHVFAVGGNAEAARRSGIRAGAVRVAVFALSGALAACGGILAASRLLAVNQSSGSGEVLLNAIAAAVIGGTSLFGGRGTVWSALTGALVIGSISNGMDLLALPSSEKFMVTGAALLLAVTIDALARERRPFGGGG